MKSVSIYVHIPVVGNLQATWKATNILPLMLHIVSREATTLHSGEKIKAV